MTDGNTPAGSFEVSVVLTGDEVEQAIRSLDWALMMDSHEDQPGHPQRMDVMAHREFIKAMRNKFQQSLDEQRP